MLDLTLTPIQFGARRGPKPGPRLKPRSSMRAACDDVLSRKHAALRKRITADISRSVGNGGQPIRISEREVAGIAFNTNTPNQQQISVAHNALQEMLRLSGGLIQPNSRQQRDRKTRTPSRSEYDRLLSLKHAALRKRIIAGISRSVSNGGQPIRISNTGLMEMLSRARGHLRVKTITAEDLDKERRLAGESIKERTVKSGGLIVSEHSPPMARSPRRLACDKELRRELEKIRAQSNQTPLVISAPQLARRVFKTKHPSPEEISAAGSALNEMVEFSGGLIRRPVGPKTKSAQ
jgi:hypothetical protein